MLPLSLPTAASTPPSPAERRRVRVADDPHKPALLARVVMRVVVHAVGEGVTRSGRSALAAAAASRRPEHDDSLWWGSLLLTRLLIDFSLLQCRPAQGVRVELDTPLRFQRSSASMENRKEEQQGAAVGSMTVPAFGEWDVKNDAVPDYSMDFSKIREMRKQNKRELSRASLGGDEDLLQAQQNQGKAQAAAAAQTGKSSAAVAADDDHRRPLHDDSPTGRKKFLSYFQCCIRA